MNLHDQFTQWAINELTNIISILVTIAFGLIATLATIHQSRAIATQLKKPPAPKIPKHRAWARNLSLLFVSLIFGPGMALITLETWYFDRIYAIVASLVALCFLILIPLSVLALILGEPALTPAQQEEPSRQG